MAEAGAGGVRGGNSAQRLGSSLDSVTSNSGWHPAVSVEALGARERNSGTLYGEGASQARPTTRWELVEAQLRAGGTSTSLGWCPLQDLRG